MQSNVETRPAACLACNSQKLKCTKEKPICSRCAKRRVDCVYPERANKKARTSNLGQQSLSPRAATSSRPTVISPALESGRDFIAVSPTSRPARSSGLETLTSRNFSDTDPDQGLSKVLVEAYFSKYFVSSLYIERTKFVLDFEAGTVPRYVLYSVFALASRFFGDVPYPSIHGSKDFVSFPELPSKGRVWAEIGSSLVLTHADEPTTFKMFACENFSLYWHSAGQLGRMAIHKAVSKAAFRVLQDRKEAVFSSNIFQSHPPLTTQVLWAFWIKTCMLEHSYMSTIEDLRHTFGYASNIYPDSTFSYLYDDNLFTLPQQHPSAGDWMNWDEVNLRSSVIPCMKLYTAWRDVKALVRRAGSHLRESYIAQLFDLDAAIQHINSGIPSELKGEEALKTSASESLRRNSFWLHSIHYLCLSYLHGSAVPQMSGVLVEGPGTAILSKTSTRTILRNTAQFLLISRIYCGSTPDFSTMPPSCYWSFFMAGWVCGTLVETSIESCKAHSEYDLRFCSLMLEQLTAFWASAGYLYTFLCERFPHTLGQSLQDATIELSRSPILKNYALDDDIVEALTTRGKPNQTLPLQFEDIFDLPSRMSNTLVPNPQRYASNTVLQRSTSEHTEQQGFTTDTRRQQLHEDRALLQESLDLASLRRTAEGSPAPSFAPDNLTTTTGPDWQGGFFSEDVLASLGATSPLGYTDIYTPGPSYSHRQ